VRPLLYLGCPHSDRAEVEQLLSAGNLSVVWAETTAAALGELERRDLPVIVDLSRGAAALQIARDLRTEHPDLLLFAVVDARRPDLTTEAVLTGVVDVFARPPSARRVALAIDRELRQSAAPAERAEDIIAGVLYHQAPLMRNVMGVIARAAKMRAGVTVRGEDGTGRQVAARAIHAAQPNADAAFVCVDCAAAEAPVSKNGEVPPRGLERISRTSRLYAAIGGTLYLQNVLEASTRVQARLARVLRDREAMLVETGEPTMVDVRPMAGVDPGIDAAVQEGRIREDLFRRLSVIRIDMPPLRSRREDIPALANYFVREICASTRVPPKTLSRAALSLVAALPWRGNALELRSLLETVVMKVGGGRTIGLEDLLAHVRLDGGAVHSTNATLRQARARFEREYIAAVLDQHHGRISEAAKALGIQRTNLYRKMRSLKVNRERRLK
jgi:two-component system nitrogen regulation response regulator NtrX